MSERPHFSHTINLELAQRVGELVRDNVPILDHLRGSHQSSPCSGEVGKEYTIEGTNYVFCTTCGKRATENKQ